MILKTLTALAFIIAGAIAFTSPDKFDRLFAVIICCTGMILLWMPRERP